MEDSVCPLLKVHRQRSNCQTDNWVYGMGCEANNEFRRKNGKLVRMEDSVCPLLKVHRQRSNCQTDNWVYGMGCEAKNDQRRNTSCILSKEELPQRAVRRMDDENGVIKVIARLTADRAVRRKTALTSVGESERDTGIKSLMEFVSEEGVWEKREVRRTVRCMTKLCKSRQIAKDSCRKYDNP